MAGRGRPRYKADRRAAYHCPDTQLTEILYDSGFADLDSLGTKAHLETAPRTRYYWAVTVRTDADEEATSAVNWFETAKQNEPWQGQWLTCDSANSRLSYAKKM